jgi:hypothetical protein
MIYNEKWLYETLKTIETDNSTYDIQENNKAEITIKVKDENSSYYLYSKYNPVKQGLEFAKANYKPSDCIIIYGLGLGYHIIPIIEDMLTKTQKLYIFELNLSILKIALERTDIRKYLEHENVILYATNNKDEAKSWLETLLKQENTTLIHYEPLLRAIPAQMEKIRALLEKQNMAVKSQNEQQENIQQNYEYNIKKGYPDAGRLFKDSFKNIPCIIVSAGHSLLNNVSDLKYAYNKAVIIASGRVSNTLSDNNITPDFYIEGSNKDFTLQHLSGSDNKIPLLMLATANKNLEDYAGEKLLLYKTSYAEDKEYAVEYGGSVATLATSFAVLAGFNPIIYIGQDLCYTSQYTHDNETDKVEAIRGGLYIDGVDGNKHFTTKQLTVFKAWIEDYIKSNPHTKFINATANGAVIKDTEYKEIKQCLNELPEFEYNVYYELMKKVYDSYGKNIEEQLYKECIYTIG